MQTLLKQAEFFARFKSSLKLEVLKNFSFSKLQVRPRERTNAIDKFFLRGNFYRNKI